MKQINNQTVELSNQELIARDRFNVLLDRGWGIKDAMIVVRSEYLSLSEDFFKWLED